MQKITYFTNLEIRRYRFQWDRYGPFSQELSYQVDDMARESYLDLTSEPLVIRQGSRIDICLTERGKKKLQEEKLPLIYKKRIVFVHDFLKNKEPREMEILASVHFIIATYYKLGRKLSARMVWEEISRLKPDSQISLYEVNKAHSELRSRNLL